MKTNDFKYEVELKENERIDDLQVKGYRIIQNTDGFCFGMDAVLLANYVEVKRTDQIVDLGTGTGIIPLIIDAKKTIKKIYGIEIQKQVADMANRSVKLNSASDRIEILNIDLNDSMEELGKNKFDIVTSNPPYMSVGEGLLNEDDRKQISRHEIKCDIDDIARVASGLLRHNGKFYLVHRPYRLPDIMVALRKYKLEPKTMRLVHPSVAKSPNLVLIKAIKSAKPELRMEEPLYVYNEDGSYTDEINKIYGLDR